MPNVPCMPEDATSSSVSTVFWSQAEAPRGVMQTGQAASETLFFFRGTRVVCRLLHLSELSQPSDQEAIIYAVYSTTEQSK